MLIVWKCAVFFFTCLFYTEMCVPPEPCVHLILRGLDFSFFSITRYDSYEDEDEYYDTKSPGQSRRSSLQRPSSGEWISLF